MGRYLATTFCGDRRLMRFPEKAGSRYQSITVETVDVTRRLSERTILMQLIKLELLLSPLSLPFPHPCLRIKRILYELRNTVILLQCTIGMKSLCCILNVHNLPANSFTEFVSAYLRLPLWKQYVSFSRPRFAHHGYCNPLLYP